MLGRVLLSPDDCYPSVGLSPALLNGGIVPSSVQLWVCLPLFPIIGWPPVLPNGGIVPSSAELWDCLQVCPIVGLSAVLPSCGIVPRSARGYPTHSEDSDPGRLLLEGSSALAVDVLRLL